MKPCINVLTIGMEFEYGTVAFFDLQNGGDCYVRTERGASTRVTTECVSRGGLISQLICRTFNQSATAL